MRDGQNTLSKESLRTSLTISQDSHPSFRCSGVESRVILSETSWCFKERRLLSVSMVMPSPIKHTGGRR